jgi:hypothetical protein
MLQALVGAAQLPTTNKKIKKSGLFSHDAGVC